MVILNGLRPIFISATTTVLLVVGLRVGWMKLEYQELPDILVTLQLLQQRLVMTKTQYY